jgi:hypothetical protein
MPPFSPIGPISQLLSKCIGYSWGKPPVLPCRVAISSIAISSDVGTIVGVLLEGNGPVVGDLAYLQGTSLQSGDLNNSEGEISSVTGPDANGNITIEFALTGSDVGTTASVGTLTTVPQPQAEEGVTGPGQALAISINAYGLSWDFNFDGDVTAQLEVAIDLAGPWIVVGSASSSETSGGAIAAAPTNANFARINITAGTADGYARILAS